MKAKVILLIAAMLGCLQAFSKDGNKDQKFSPNSGTSVMSSSKRTINNLDSMIFDLASATITATYLDLPIYIKSDDQIKSMDYAMKFTLSKLTYSTTINPLPPDPMFNSLAYFNPNTLFLKYTGSLQNGQGFPASGAMNATIIRFALSAPCVKIDTSDFTNLLGLLNGVRCSFRKTYLNFNQFIPGANFSNSPPCLNSTVQFTDISTVANGTISSWQWNFGNNGTSTLQAPATVYTGTGTSTATLIVTTAMGCKDTVALSLNITPPPVSAFSYTFDCLKDSVFFTNASTIPSGSIVSSFWNFGDGIGTSTAENPVYHYNTSGLFTTTLISTSNFSCTSTATVVVALNNKVTASFTATANNYCLGATVSFSDGTTYSNPITAWDWNFGDGATSTLQNPSHTYTTAGTYSVTLTSTSTDGCKGNVTKVITISPPPTVQFAVSSATGCAFAPSVFTDLSTTPPGSTYLWYFGDGSTSTSQNPAHNYAAAGSYSVKLVVTTPGGCSDSLTKQSFLLINNSPLTSFSLSSRCIQVNVNFLNNTTIGSGSIVSWAWSFGDGNTSTALNPSNTYTASGTYTVSLTATSDLGCTATHTEAVSFTPKPTVSFEYATGAINCSGQTLTFLNLSTPAIGPSYIWQFGDGNMAVQQNPVHTYSFSGTYPIKLIVINPGGCSDSLTKTYTATLPLPAIPLFSDSVIANSIVSFTNLSTNAISISWSFGDNQTSTEDNPTHTFPDAATYEICLTAYNSLNCPNTLCKDIYVGLASIVAIPSGFTPNQDNVNDVLRVLGGPFIEMEFKIFNEWGNLLFSSPTQDMGWDGSFKGEPQPVGVYEYVLRGKTIDKKNINLYGAVNLTR